MDANEKCTRIDMLENGYVSEHSLINALAFVM